ncbi:acyl-CoA thioesterase [Streptomyces sp. H72]
MTMTTTLALPLAHAPARPLLETLSLVPVGPDAFRALGTVPATGSAVFGGQTVAQALSSAGRTVPGDREPHSLHGYFLFRADPARPITYRVERLRDGHSFTSRRVVAVQPGGRGEQEVFHMTASFKRTSRPGAEHQVDMPATQPPHHLPHAADAPPAHVHPAVIRLLSDLRDAVDVRYTDRSGPVTRVWFRVRELPDDVAAGGAALHQCLVAYLSDLTLLDSASPHHRTGLPNDGQGAAASLDHAMWFHRPLRADQWLLYEQRSPSTADGRALAHARIYTSDGALAATVVQEGVMRPGRAAGRDRAPEEAAEPDIDPFSWAVAKPETD